MLQSSARVARETLDPSHQRPSAVTAKPTMLAVLLVLALPAAWGSPDWGYPQGHSYFHSHQYTMPLYGPPAAYAGPGL